MAQPVSLQYIQDLFGATILQRGKTYYNAGHVGKLSLAGSKLTASVRGNDVQPYKVTVTLQDKGSSSNVSRASCSCPYEHEFGGYCKHIAAVLLKYHHQGADEDSSDLAAKLVEALLELPQQDLRTVLSNTFTHQPEVVNPLYIQLQQHVHSSPVSRTSEPSTSATNTSATNTSATSTSASSTSITSAVQVSIDTRPFVLLMQKAAAKPTLDWDGFPDYREVYEVLDEVRPLFENVAYHDGLALMWDLIASYIDTVNNNEDLNYDSSGIGFTDESLIYDLDAMLAEALLGVRDTLDDEARDKRLEQLHNWNDDISNEWTGGSFNMSIHALTYGFDDTQHFLEYMQGDYDELALKVLRKTGRSDQALDFALKSAQGADYLLLLLERGQLAKVQQDYHEHIASPLEAKRVAEGLAAYDVSLATKVLELGFKLLTKALADDAHFYIREGDTLINYAILFALQHGNTQLNLDANLFAFNLRPNMTSFESLQTLAPDWPNYKQDLLKRLQTPTTFYLYDPREAVNIFLREACYDEAIRITEQFPHDTTLIIKVMDAVIHSHSAWVIDTAKEQAEVIMDAGNSNRYEDAVTYLSYVKDAYLAHDRIEPWEDYVQGLVDTHKRKRKLMGLMKPLLE